MNLQAKIAWWLDHNGAFAEGYQLYQEAGQTAYLQEFKRVAALSFTPPTVYDRLRVALMAQEAVLTKVKRRQVTSPETDEPDAILSLRKKGINLKRIESDVHGQMKALVATGEPANHQTQLYELAKRMMEEIQPGLDETYSAIRAWEREGSIPVAGKAQIVADTVQKMKRYENLRKRISKLNGLLKKDIEAGDRQKYEQEVTTKQEEMESLRQELQL